MGSLLLYYVGYIGYDTYAEVKLRFQDGVGVGSAVGQRSTSIIASLQVFKKGVRKGRRQNIKAFRLSSGGRGLIITIIVGTLIITWIVVEGFYSKLAGKFRPQSVWLSDTLAQ